MSEIMHNLQRDGVGAPGDVEQLRDQLREALAENARIREDNRRRLREFAREVRVPLTSVLGFTDLLSVTHKGHPDELNQIAKAGHQLMSLVTGLEETAAQDSGGLSATGPSTGPEESAARTVLHIEDNETNFRLIERILEDRANLNLRWAATGEEGISVALRENPSLVLLDLNLPDMHGSDLLARLKSHPVGRHMPVIVLSADVSPSQIERMLQAGALNYLTKPFDIKRLLCLVDEALATAGVR